MQRRPESVGPSRGFDAATRAMLELALAGTGTQTEGPTRWRKVPTEALLSACDRHGLAPLVRQALPPDAPEGLRSGLRDRQAGLWAQNRRLLAACADACEALHEAGIASILLKGVYLLPFVYRDLAARPTSDVDLLVPEPTLADAVRALAARGFEAPPSWAEGSFRAHDFHVPLTRPRDGALVELHWNLASPGRYAIDAEALWTRAQPLEAAAAEGSDDAASEAATVRAQLAAAGAQRLDDEDLLLHLSVHATTSYLVARLSWLIDIRLVAWQRPPDWSRLLERARAQQAAVATSLALAASQDLVGLRLPPEVRSHLVLHPWRLGWLARLLDRLPPGPAEHRLWRTAYAALVMEGPGNVARHAMFAWRRDAP